jgi:hypothetical protein
VSRSAKITSIELLPRLAAGLQRFRGEAAGAVDDIEAEIRRALDWIHHDRKDYWTQQLRRSEDAVSQARVQLQQARVMRRVGDYQPACVDEQRALDRARRRLETAQRKVHAVQHWSQVIDRAVEEFQQDRTGFVNWLDIDLPRAVAALDRMSQSLASYVSLEVASDSPPIEGGGGDREPASPLPPGEGQGVRATEEMLSHNKGTPG